MQMKQLLIRVVPAAQDFLLCSRLVFFSRIFGFGLAYSLLKKRRGRVRFSGPPDRELSYSGQPSFSLRSSFFISVCFAFVFAFFQITSWSFKN
jgi:hypothetical protein